MEVKSFFTMIFLLSILLPTPCMSRGILEVANPEIYEIDYRGPETHSSIIPPPGRSHGRPMIHQESAKASLKSKGLRGGKIGKNAKKIHG